MAVQEKNRRPGMENVMHGRQEQMVGLRSWSAALYGRESKYRIPLTCDSCLGYWGLISNCEPFLHCLASVCAPFLVVT